MRLVFEASDERRQILNMEGMTEEAIANELTELIKLYLINADSTFILITKVDNDA